MVALMYLAKSKSFTTSLRRVFQSCVTGGVPRRSFFIALVVGIILNAINQGDVLIAGGDVNGLKVLLTFIVPYCVATYGAVSYQLSASKAGQPAQVDSPTTSLESSSTETSNSRPRPYENDDGTDS